MTDTTAATRDWYAAFLTDRVTMDAARRRATQTGDDGWAAAFEVAATVAPGLSSHLATGARAIIAPGADGLDELEEQRLQIASTFGYYPDPNISGGNADMSASMTRRLRPGEQVLPDLICPDCCLKQARDPESGVQRQAYRCPQCRQAWEYVPPVDDDTYATAFAPLEGSGVAFIPMGGLSGISIGWSCGQCDSCRAEAAGQPLPMVCPRCLGDMPAEAQGGRLYSCPACERYWLVRRSEQDCTPPPELFDEGSVATLVSPDGVQQELFRTSGERMAELASRVFGIPMSVLARAQGRIEEMAQCVEASALAVHVENQIRSAQADALTRAWFPELEVEPLNERDAAVAMRDFLQAVALGKVRIADADGWPELAPARRRQWVVVPLWLGGRMSGRTQRLLHLTQLGRMELYRLRRELRQSAQ